MTWEAGDVSPESSSSRRHKPCDSSTFCATPTPHPHADALICKMKSLEKMILKSFLLLSFYDCAHRVQSTDVKTVLENIKREGIMAHGEVVSSGHGGMDGRVRVFIIEQH